MVDTERTRKSTERGRKPDELVPPRAITARTHLAASRAHRRLLDEHQQVLENHSGSVGQIHGRLDTLVKRVNTLEDRVDEERTNRSLLWDDQHALIAKTQGDVRELTSRAETLEAGRESNVYGAFEQLKSTQFGTSLVWGAGVSAAAGWLGFLLAVVALYHR